MRNLLKDDGENIKLRDIILYNKKLVDNGIFYSTRKIKNS